MDPQHPTPGADVAAAGGFQQQRAAGLSADEIAGLTRILDVQERSPAVARLRAWAADRLAARPGQTCLDVGCGTGSQTRALAERVGPAGRAIGVDPNPGLLQVARSRTPAGLPVEWVEGTAQHLPFGDGTVDVLRCERVLQHVADPQVAVAQFARVLRPGGRVALLDSDWGTAILHVGEPELARRAQESTWRAWPNPFSGRRLAGQLRAAGLLVDPDVGSAALVATAPDLVADRPLGVMVRQTVLHGELDEPERDRLLAAVEQAIAAGDAFVAVTMFAVLATRPAPAAR